MRTSTVILAIGVAGSLAIHVGLAVGMSRVKGKKTHESTTVTMVGGKEKKKKAEDEKKKDEPPKPIVTPPKTVAKTIPRAAPPPTPAPVPEAAPAPVGPVTVGNAFNTGLSFGNGGGGGSMAIPMGNGGMGGAAPTTTASATTTAKPVEKSFGKATTSATAPVIGEGDCAEAEVKPARKSSASAVYTDDARSAGVGGKVMVRVTIDANGNVTDARVTKGLGHGLDESAVAAARHFSYAPATRCGKPVSSTSLIPFVFELGE